MVDLGAQGASFVQSKTQSGQQVERILLQKRVIENLRKSVLNGSGAIAGLPLEDPTLGALIGQYNNALTVLEKFEGAPELDMNKEAAESALASVRKRLVDATGKVTQAYNMSLQSAVSSEAEYAGLVRSVPGLDRSMRDVQRKL